MTENIPQEILFDTRLQERFIRQGLITRKQLEEWKDKLIDLETEPTKTDVAQSSNRN